jgi:hypothetical protein
MNAKNLTIVLACAASVIALAGCVRAAAIYNVNDAPVTATTAKSLSTAQVRTAIIAAGTSMGWRIVDAGPGKLEGTLVLREHTAVATIPYSGKAYSIVYKSSVNLQESGGTIHSNYNGWVQNLDRAIRTEIARL